MAWVILIISGLFEAIWATALGESDGFSRLGPSIVFFAALAFSMAGLGWAVKRIPIGTAYAVWVGIGTTLTVIYAMATGAEEFAWLKVLFIAGIVLAVIGLKLAPDNTTTSSMTSDPPD